MDKPNTTKNGFSRKFSVTITPLRVATMDIKNPRIAGISADDCFLYTIDQPDISVFDKRLEKSSFLRVPLTKSTLKLRVFVDFPKIYISNSKSSDFYIYDYNTEEKISYSLKYRTGEYSVLPNKTIVGVYLNASEMGTYREIGIFDLKTDSFYMNKKGGLSKVYDGGFYQDGMLHYDVFNDLIVYIFRFRNKVLAFDSALNISFSFSTIDTFSTTQLKILKERNKSDNKLWNYTLAKPPRSVNNKSCVADGYAFVCSYVKADNENLSAFDKNSVVDVYRIIDGEYAGSFYIPHHEGKPLSDFIVTDNKLLVVYDNNLSLFQVII
ncbi:hypothetical protein [Parapedobacter sp. 2B3]|uniref:hypothetical protein n=1 Tax=Parapedobacter sp. 2B3 TaxID=3342381 RepID=UPI0035B5EA68